jgi:hypothetical protein
MRAGPPHRLGDGSGLHRAGDYAGADLDRTACEQDGPPVADVNQIGRFPPPSSK